MIVTMKPSVGRKLAAKIAKDEAREARRIAREWVLIERREARAKKLAATTYEGKPCPKGHTLRYRNCNHCVECNHATQRNRHRKKP